MVVSVSTERASLAAIASWRRRASATAVCGLLRSSSDSAPPEAVVDVREHGVVEVDPAEAFDALGGAEDVDADVALAQHGGVEGAAAEVVDRDGVAVGRGGGWRRSARRPPRAR